MAICNQIESIIAARIFSTSTTSPLAGRLSTSTRVEMLGQEFPQGRKGRARTEALHATDAAVVLATHDRQLQRDTASWPRLSLTGVASTSVLHPAQESSSA